MEKQNGLSKWGVILTFVITAITIGIAWESLRSENNINKERIAAAEAKISAELATVKAELGASILKREAMYQRFADGDAKLTDSVGGIKSDIAVLVIKVETLTKQIDKLVKDWGS